MTERRFSLEQNALLPIVFSPSGSVIETIPHLRKAPQPIAVRFRGSVTEDRLLHPSRSWFPPAFLRSFTMILPEAFREINRKNIGFPGRSGGKLLREGVQGLVGALRVRSKAAVRQLFVQHGRACFFWRPDPLSSPSAEKTRGEGKRFPEKGKNICRFRFRKSANETR